MNKKILASLLIILTSSTFISAWRGGGFHGGWRGGGWGRGGWGHHGYWGRGGWGPRWGLGVAPAIGFSIGASRNEYRESNYKDDMDRRYWIIKNDATFPILVKASGYGYKQIRPGQKRQIDRGLSFNLSVKNPQDRTIRFSTTKHFVRIVSNDHDSLAYETWNE